MGGNGFKLKEGRFWLDVGEKSFPVNATRPWHCCPEQLGMPCSWRCSGLGWMGLCVHCPCPGALGFKAPCSSSRSAGPRCCSIWWWWQPGLRCAGQAAATPPTGLFLGALLSHKALTLPRGLEDACLPAGAVALPCHLSEEGISVAPKHSASSFSHLSEL